MNDEDLFPFPLNLENQFKLSKFANFEELNAVKNHKVSKDGSFSAPVLFLQNVVLFPNTITPLSFNSKSLEIDLINGAQEQKETLIGCYEDSAAQPGHTLAQSLPVGIEFVPSRLNSEDPEAPMALLQGRRRVQILELRESHGLVFARVSPIKEVRSTAKETKALMRQQSG